MNYVYISWVRFEFYLYIYTLSCTFNTIVEQKLLTMSLRFWHREWSKESEAKRERGGRYTLPLRVEIECGRVHSVFVLIFFYIKYVIKCPLRCIVLLVLYYADVCFFVLMLPVAVMNGFLICLCFQHLSVNLNEKFCIIYDFPYAWKRIRHI